MKISKTIKTTFLILALALSVFNGFAQLEHKKNATSQNQVLPVSLISFNLKTEKPNEIIVSWSTEKEINNNYFSVEVSKDGNYFFQVGQVNGVGNGDNIHNYQFIIRNVASIKFTGALPLLIFLLIPCISNRKLRLVVFSLFIFSIISCKKENEAEPDKYYVRLIQTDYDGKRTYLGQEVIELSN